MFFSIENPPLRLGVFARISAEFADIISNLICVHQRNLGEKFVVLM